MPIAESNPRCPHIIHSSQSLPLYFLWWRRKLFTGSDLGLCTTYSTPICYEWPGGCLGWSLHPYIHPLPPQPAPLSNVSLNSLHGSPNWQDSSRSSRRRDTWSPFYIDVLFIALPASSCRSLWMVPFSIKMISICPLNEEEGINDLAWLEWWIFN